MRRSFTMFLLFVSLLFVGSETLTAQVTTGAVAGVVTDANGAPVSGASVIAVHVPSGTRYGAITRTDGRYSIPGMRVGGPYRVTVSHIGFETQERDGIQVSLGSATDLPIRVRERAVEVEGVTATAERQQAIMSPDRTGASTTVTREALASLPTISGRLTDVARLTPQSSGGSGSLSIGGQDPRMNNITVDGSYFNNSFGLRNAPGETSGVAPISLSAIEQFQINIAPYDVRHGNFVGAGINTVTRSGTNDLRGSLFYSFRNNDFVGTEAAGIPFNPGTFDYSNIGGWLSGAIVKNKLFFFASYEDEALTQPGTTFRANAGGEPVTGSTTRVLASDLDQLSTYLRTNFNYETGPYQGYDFSVPGKRFLGKLDFNLNDKNKFTLRYNRLESSTDQLVSNSSSLGFSTANQRRTNPNGLNFANSNYSILENINSVVGEWNSVFSSRWSNSMIAGYTYQDESRGYKSSMFPFVDILNSGSVYTSFGFEPFTPNNELKYSTYQFQNNVTRYGEKHDLTFGVSAEKYHSENVFFQGAQSVYVYNSLADFYTDANAFLNNAACQADALSAGCRNRTSPVSLRSFQVGYNNIPTNEKPLQPLDVVYGGLYAQDEFKVNERLKITAGVRMDVPFFENTAYNNPNANGLTFRDQDGNPVQYDSGKLPDAAPLFSPRLGINWDVRGDRSTQVRGGTGVFTGKPAYVWISNQIGNTGMLTGFRSATNTTNFPFNPNPDAYKPPVDSITGRPATSYTLNVTDPDFKFPQTWRTNLGIDQRLPWGLIATAELIYNRDVNGISYINANLPAAQGAFTGADTRPRWVGPSCTTPSPTGCVNRINNAAGNQVTANYVISNQNDSHSWNTSFTLEKPFNNGLFVRAAYNYGLSYNTVDPGSIAAGTWQNNPISADPNNPEVALSANAPGERMFLYGSYRKQWFKFGATSLSLYWERRDIGNASYIYSGDLNGDGGSNDLIYIPRDVSEMNFAQFTTGTGTSARTWTAAEQATAWEAYIQQDEYLREHRGEYAERGAVWLPKVTRADLSLSQELFTDILNKRNTITFRADIVNVGNLLNKDWGVSQRLQSTGSPLTNPGVDALGRATYRLRLINNNTEFVNSTFEKTNTRADVYEVQFRVVYTFGGGQ